ncbi:alginate O-acetyltransferase AlgX-related protein [Flavilitoribacter nigricans]|uniref:AlgX/AlgJ SGNH hydrolase-like domain-containing protein n=1 Tax=Flavilitoribacter nigricans (strain ATCC 23147 / DSM 23189 / NBRC 102662 / NCIMB 1420 / SS-2) TaxID=1122177 RepID=A0A2D0N2U1_FLAN2|nr:hypothetical protein [Flavilitoribacter nigricans]PHN02841.1 hypothetical protein CRP01_30130 [Flavilitoribacter nigricans DSM 23189 = NBRC 102662]
MIKRQKLKVYLLPILFVGLMVAHGLDSIFQWLPEPDLQEKRALVEKPELDLSFLDPFPGDYERYYNDHFNWRNYYIRAGAYLNYHAFRQSALPAKVIIGKDGWLYKAGFQMKMYQGKYRFSPQDLEIIREELEYRKQVVEAGGGKYYLCLAPMKPRIYPEFLPDNVRKLNPQDCALQLVDHLNRHSDISYIDLFTPLQELKQRGSPLLYLKTDHHWTDYAGMLAAKVILDHLRQDFPQITGIDTSIIKFNTAHYNGLSLAHMLGLDQEMTENPPVYDGAMQFRALDGSRSYPIPAKFPFPEEYCMVRILPQADLPKLLMVRESFATPLIKLLGDHFRESVFLFDNWKHELHPEIIEQEAPDIYIQMIWEGMLFNLLPHPPREAGW